MATGIVELTPGGEESAARQGSSTQARLRDQISWYDAKSGANQRWFKRIKIAQIVLAASIPVAAGPAPTWLVGAAGALIAVLEGVQQLQQYQQNWTSYRATCEQLKHEQFLFEARAGAYKEAQDPEVVLAERIEGIVSQEHAAWVAQREEAGGKPGVQQ